MNLIFIKILWATVCVITFVSVSACSPSKDEVAAQAKVSMQQKLDTDETLSRYSLKVESITIVEEAKNKYKGMAGVRYEGSIKNVAIDIVADGEDLIWQASPMAFAFVMLSKNMAENYKEGGVDENISSPAGMKWTVQVASLSNDEVAAKLTKEIAQRGYKSYLKKIDGVNRIYVGPYNDRLEAERIRDTLNRQQKLNGFVVRYLPEYTGSELLLKP